MRIGTLSLKLQLTVGEEGARDKAEERAESGPPFPVGVLGVIAERLSGGSDLPPDVIAWARATYGVDLSEVRVFADDRARRLNAEAGSTGLTIGDREILVSDPADQETIWHEATHAAQAADHSAATGESREADAARAEVYARRPPGGQPPQVDLKLLADRVYELFVEKVRRDKERRL